MIKTIKGDDIYSNTYVICRFDSCIVIDPSHDMASIDQAIGERKVIGVGVTHAHADHVDLLQMFDAPIYIHREDAHLLFEDQYNGYLSKPHPYQRKQLDIKMVEDDDVIKIADQQIKIIHTPGHTAGSISFLYLEHLFTGDTLFKESVGRHDLYSGSLKSLKQSVLKLMDLNSNIKIYPGHDELTTMRNEKKKNPFYIKWVKQYKR